jgi:hypothetical protein
MKKQNRRAGRATAAYPPQYATTLVAMTLAQDVAEFMEADEEHRNDLVCTALAAGEWLSEVKRPGRWDTLEVAAVLRLLPPGPPRERDRFLLTLVGLLGFAAFDGRLPSPPAVRCLEEIESLTDDPIIKELASRTAAGLANPQAPPAQ